MTQRNEAETGWRTRLAHAIIVRTGLWRRAMTLGVRAIVVDDAHRILLVRHTYVPGWYLPGGGVERGESVRAAIYRELREECGLMPAAEPVLMGLFRNTAGSGRDHVALYLVRALPRLDGKIDSNEIAESAFFVRNALPAGTTRATLARLAEHFDHQPQSETW